MSKMFELLVVRAYANLRTEVSRYYLNYLWWVVEPCLTMATFYLVFSIFLNRGTENFVAFLLVGLVPWQWFASSVNQASNSIWSGGNLMMQVDIKKIFFPLEIILRGAFKNLFVVTLLLIFLVFYPTPVSITWVALPILMCVQFLFILGIGIFCAALVPFVPDAKFVISSVLRLAMYGSGTFYSIDSVILPQHRSIMYMNPMAGLIKNYREILMYARWPDWHYLLNLTIAGSILLFFSVYVLHKLDYVYPRLCQK